MFVDDVSVIQNRERGRSWRKQCCRSKEAPELGVHHRLSALQASKLQLDLLMGLPQAFTLRLLVIGCTLRQRKFAPALSKPACRGDDSMIGFQRHIVRTIVGSVLPVLVHCPVLSSAQLAAPIAGYSCSHLLLVIAPSC